MDEDDFGAQPSFSQYVFSLFVSSKDDHTYLSGRLASFETRASLNRYFELVASRIYRQYFTESFLYNGKIKMFRRRCRVFRLIYMRIHDILLAHDNYFVQEKNCSANRGILSHATFTLALKMLAYGFPPDVTDYYLSISKTTG